MRILHLVDNFLPAGGGIARGTYTLARAQAERGHDVSVATLSRVDAPAYEEMEGVRVFRLDGLVRHARRFSADTGHQFHPTFRDPQLVVRLQELVGTVCPQVVHAHGWIIYSVLPLRLPHGCALVLGLRDLSLVCARKTLLRDDGSICSGPPGVPCLSCSIGYYGAAKGVLLQRGLILRDRSYPLVDLFVANSAYVADVSARGTSVDRDRIVVVPSPVPDVPAPTAARPDFLPSEPFVLFVGALGRHKGIDVLLRAHELLGASVPLVLLGMPRSDTPDLDRPGVVVRHNVPHDVVMASWRAAAVGAVPSVCAEALGLAAIEAMMSGTPVVATRVGGLQEVVVDGGTGLLVNPGDAAALADALGSLLADEPTRRAMGECGAVRARDYFASSVVPRVLEAYDIARSHARARG